MNNNECVTVVCPYWVVTEFHERFMDKTGKPKGPGTLGVWLKMIVPRLVEKITVERFLKPAVSRISGKRDLERQKRS